MTDGLGDLFTPLTSATPTGARPKPHRHVWLKCASFDDLLATGGNAARTWFECSVCGKSRDEDRARAGRNNRKRGGRIQRQRIVGLGGQNLAGNNPNLDGIGERFRYESKSGGSFSERYWRWLKGIPVLAGQAGVLIVTDAPGPGHRARSIVVVDYETWRDEHGEAKP